MAILIYNMQTCCGLRLWWIWVFFFEALKSYSQCYRKKVTHAGDQRSVSPNFVCNMGRCWRFFARSTRFDLKAPPEADALNMWKKGCFFACEPKWRTRIKIHQDPEKKTAACFSPWRFIDLSRFGCSNGSIWVCHGDGLFSSAKKGVGSSGHRSLQILRGVPEIMALTSIP